MGLSLYIFLAATVVLVFSLLLQEYLVLRINRNLSAIESYSEETKWSFDKSLVEEEQFKIEFDQVEWDNLMLKLNNTRFYEPLKATKRFEFGFNIDFARELIEYWKNEFNWKKQVDVLNKYSHYRIKVNGITLHYIRVNDYQQKNSMK